jgi:HPt (histidine-containing phosphotransfer) domain-containing protein
MAIRDREPNDRGARLVQLEAENARLRRLAAELADDVAELQAARGAGGRDGAVDLAHRLLAGAPPRN